MASNGNNNNSPEPNNIDHNNSSSLPSKNPSLNASHTSSITALEPLVNSNNLTDNNNLNLSINTNPLDLQPGQLRRYQSDKQLYNLEMAYSETKRRQIECANLVLFSGCGMFGLSGGANISPDPMNANNPNGNENKVDVSLIQSETNVYNLSPIPLFCGSGIECSNISLGASHVIAVSTNGTVYSWGDNNNGQLGFSNDSNNKFLPSSISSLETRVIESGMAGYSYSCFLSSTGELLACGNGEFGQLGINVAITQPDKWDMEDHKTPTLCRQLKAFSVTIVAMACGERHTLALTSLGAVYGFGDGSSGALGLDSSIISKSSRVPVPTLINALFPSPVVGIAAGASHSLAVLATGEVFSFGAGKKGQLGHGSSRNETLPCQISSLAGITISCVCASSSYSIALSNDGKLYSFGENTHGQLGLGSFDHFFVPTLIKALDHEDIIAISCGSNHVLALAGSQTLYGWGSCSSGQLSLGEAGVDGVVLNDRCLPEVINSPFFTERPILQISAGSDASAVIVGPKYSCNLNNANKATTPINHNVKLLHPSAPSSLVPSASVVNRGFMLTQFDFSHINSLIEKSRRSNDYSELINFIATTFSSPSLMNGNFLMPSKGSSGQHLIAADLVERTYNLILMESFVQPKLYTVLVHALQKNVSLLLDRVRQKPPISIPSSYRCLLMILQSPHLSDAKQSESALVGDIASIVRKLPREAIDQMRKWLSHFPSEVFSTRIVNMLVKLINTRLEQQSRVQGTTKLRSISDEVQGAVELLNIAYEANQSVFPHLCPPHLFYCSAIGQHVDLGNDFTFWLQSKDPSSRSFSFCRYPFVLDPLTKTVVLRLEQNFHIRERIFSAMIHGEEVFLNWKIRRDHLLEDAINQINASSPWELKRPLKISFQGEEGIDQGGVSQEFFVLLFRELTDTKFGLFSYNEDSRMLYYDSSQPLDPTRKDMFFIAGTVLALALYNGVSVDANFPLAFYKHLLDIPLNLEDFIQFDPVVGKSLENVLSYEGSVEEMCLTFSMDINGKEIPLIAGGNDVAVTNENREAYVNAYVTYVLSKVVASQIDNFVKGFKSICYGQAMKLFTAGDLELVLVGTPNLNFSDLEKTARYEGGYSPDHQTIKDFWSIVKDFSVEDKRAFLQFTTGSSRSPLGGLSALRLLIQRAGPDTENLPTGHTCFHAILIPEYSSQKKLKEKLKLALVHGTEGFGLQ